MSSRTNSRSRRAAVQRKKANGRKSAAAKALSRTKAFKARLAKPGTPAAQPSMGRRQSGVKAPPVDRDGKDDSPQLRTRFQPGDPVVTRVDIPAGHCRTPEYLRGKAGVIERCLGYFRNPQQLAYGQSGLPKTALYTVRYPQASLWSTYSGPKSDTLLADIYDAWLDPA